MNKKKKKNLKRNKKKYTPLMIMLSLSLLALISLDLTYIIKSNNQVRASTIYLKNQREHKNKKRFNITDSNMINNSNIIKLDQKLKNNTTENNQLSTNNTHNNLDTLNTHNNLYNTINEKDEKENNIEVNSKKSSENKTNQINTTGNEQVEENTYSDGGLNIKGNYFPLLYMPKMIVKDDEPPIFVPADEYVRYHTINKDHLIIEHVTYQSELLRQLGNGDIIYYNNTKFQIVETFRYVPNNQDTLNLLLSYDNADYPNITLHTCETTQFNSPQGFWVAVPINE